MMNMNMNSMLHLYFRKRVAEDTNNSVHTDFPAYKFGKLCFPGNSKLINMKFPFYQM